MRQIVKDTFRAWSRQFEGEVPWMYLDVKGLVTVGVGNLIDPVSQATILPFVMPDGSPASAATIAAEWRWLKSHTEAARLGYRYAQQFTSVRLTDEGIGSLVAEKLQTFWAFMLAHYFPDGENWPAAAQLAACSMAWACGPGWPLIFGNCAASAKKQDWAGCAKECEINSKGNVGVIPRNRANVALFQFAAQQPTDEYDSLDVP